MEIGQRRASGTERWRRECRHRRSQAAPAGHFQASKMSPQQVDFQLTAAATKRRSCKKDDFARWPPLGRHSVMSSYSSEPDEPFDLEPFEQPARLTGHLATEDAAAAAVSPNGAAASSRWPSSWSNHAANDEKEVEQERATGDIWPPSVAPSGSGRHGAGESGIAHNLWRPTGANHGGGGSQSVPVETCAGSRRTSSMASELKSSRRRPRQQAGAAAESEQAQVDFCLLQGRRRAGQESGPAGSAALEERAGFASAQHKHVTQQPGELSRLAAPSSPPAWAARQQRVEAAALRVESRRRWHRGRNDAGLTSERATTTRRRRLDGTSAPAHCQVNEIDHHPHQAANDDDHDDDAGQTGKRRESHCGGSSAITIDEHGHHVAGEKEDEEGEVELEFEPNVQCELLERGLLLASGHHCRDARAKTKTTTTIVHENGCATVNCVASREAVCGHEQGEEVGRVELQMTTTMSQMLTNAAAAAVSADDNDQLRRLPGRLFEPENHTSLVAGRDRLMDADDELEEDEQDDGPALAASRTPPIGQQQQQQQRQQANNSNTTASTVTQQQQQQSHPNSEQQPQQQPLQRQYPPNHPLGNSKHLCSICGDRATGKHYGVFSCEGCKGFFKRTIRKDIVYVCRSQGACLIDMRQRNRCQYCRYQKCLQRGMKREAVQEEKQRLKMRAAAASLANSNNNNNNANSQHHYAINYLNDHNNNEDGQVQPTNVLSSNSANRPAGQCDTPGRQQQFARVESTTSMFGGAGQPAANHQHHHHHQHHHQHAFPISPYHNHSNSSNHDQNHHQSTTLTNNASPSQPPNYANEPHTPPHQRNTIAAAAAATTTTGHRANGFVQTAMIDQHHHNHPNNHHNHHNHQQHHTNNHNDFQQQYRSQQQQQQQTVGLHQYHRNSLQHSSHPFRLTAGDQIAKLDRIDELTLKWAAQVQIERLLDWAKSVPKFSELLVDDQVTLLKAYWNELIIADMAFRTVECLRDGSLPSPAGTPGQRRASSSSPSPPGSRQLNSGRRHQISSLCIGRNLFINEHQAHEIGLGTMFERIINELVCRMADMRLDANELACLRAIILFNPETHGLKTSQPIEETRGDIYTTLELYCREHYDNQPNRFGKLLLRLPVLRSIGLKCDSGRRGTAACDMHQPVGQSFGPTDYPAATTGSASNGIGYSSSSADSLALYNGVASPASSGSSSVNSTCSSQQSVASSATSNQLVSTTTASPAAIAKAPGYQVKLLFFDLCYETTAVDSFLRSSLSLH